MNFSPNTNYSIYALSCPIDGKVKYVGCSIDLVARYKTHLSTPYSSTRKWIESLKKQGLKPIMTEVEFIESPKKRQEVESREAYWIKHYYVKEGTLLNRRHNPEHSKKVELPINFLDKNKKAYA
jgi:hypothetical protein